MIYIILIILATVIITIFLPVALLACFISNGPNKKTYLRRIAISIDQLGCVVYGPLFDIIFITKKSEFKFGDEDETISSVLGKNQLCNTLTIHGWLIVKFLDFADKKGHCISAIEQNYKRKMKNCCLVNLKLN